MLVSHELKKGAFIEYERGMHNVIDCQYHKGAGKTAILHNGTEFSCPSSSSPAKKSWSKWRPASMSNGRSKRAATFRDRGASHGS